MVLLVIKTRMGRFRFDSVLFPEKVAVQGAVKGGETGGNWRFNRPIMA
jgi:hypothetical protein